MTPLPIDVGGAAPVSATKSKSNTLLIVGVLVLLLAGVGVIAAVVILGKEEPAPVVRQERPVQGETLSTARQREEAARQRVEERNRRLITGEGATELLATPAGAQATPAPTPLPPTPAPTPVPEPTPAPAVEDSDAPPSNSPFLN